ncbi:MAG: LuxR C-terminal-related transcriptional regulator [Polyangiaceae bacterium]
MRSSRPRGARAKIEQEGQARVVLTPRETEIVALVASGLQNKEVAARLGISPATVKAHVTVCFLKCGVPTRTALAAWFLGARMARQSPSEEPDDPEPHPAPQQREPSGARGRPADFPKPFVLDRRRT